MKISIFGLGYVGCVSLGCLAQNGFEVIGVDISATKVDLINRGVPTIIEREIDRIISEQFRAGKIQATQDYWQAVRETDVSIICVGTPSLDSGHLNLDYIYQTARQIGEALKDKGTFQVIVIRSTVMPGTNHKVGEVISQASGLERNADFAVVSNPEFLREGSAIHDYYNPPFTLVGSDNARATALMREMYAQVKGEVIQSDIKTAEIIKYVNNSYHALKVTFANEVGNICKKLGIDSHAVMRLFCLDTQLNISPYYFKPGFAYGGSCLPKDLKALKTLASESGFSSPVLEAIEPSNQNHIKMATDLIISCQKKKIGILGIAFKDGTDDLRYSPIIKVIECLTAEGFEVRVHDQYVNEALLIGSNKEYLEKNLPYLFNMMYQNELDLIEWAEVVVFNRKSPSYQDLPLKNPDVSFVDLVRTGTSISLQNYEGICW